MNTPRKRNYFTLLVFSKEHGWEPVFGDYVRKVVAGEEDECYYGQRTKIICTWDGQTDIDARVAELNEELSR